MAGIKRPGPHQLYRNPRVSIEGRELGALDAGSIRVQMVHAGICGTDILATRADPATGYVLGSAPMRIGADGRVLGHEGVGRVVETGAQVRDLSSGDYVTFSSIVTCFRCDPCRRGDFNQCENATLFGMERDGLFGTVVDVPAQLAYSVNEIVETEHGLQAAACIEPAGCAFTGARAARISAGDHVLITGGGPIGLFAAMLAREVFGAARVSVVEPVPFRRELARRWADQAEDVDTFFSASGDRSFDVLIEASGALQNIDLALPQLAANGRVVLLARSGAPLSLGHVDHLITNNIAIMGSRGHLGGAFGSVLGLYAAGRVPLHEAVTATVEGLEGIKACLDDPDIVLHRNCKVLANLAT